MDEIKVEDADADAMHVDMMAEHARQTADVAKRAAPQLARLKSIIELVLPHEFPRLDGPVKAVLDVFPAGGTSEIDMRPAAVVECMRLIGPNVPQHAASLLLSVSRAWPGVSWPAVYTTVHDASSTGFWAPVDLSASRTLPLSDLFVLATAVSAHLSMRSHVQRIGIRQLMLPPDAGVVECETANPFGSMAFPARMSLAEVAAEGMLGSPEIAHIWAVLARAGDACVVDAFASVFGGPDDGDTSAASLAVASAVRLSIGRLTAPRFLRTVQLGLGPVWTDLSYGALANSLLDVLLWPDIAKLAVLMHKNHPRCLLSFRPLSQACEGGVAPALLSTLNEMGRVEFDANAAIDAATLRGCICMPGKGVNEVDPRMYREWAETTFDLGELFADTRLRNGAKHSKDVQVLPIDVDESPSFVVHRFTRHGVYHFIPHPHVGTSRDIHFFRQHLNFLYKHRPGTLSEGDVRIIMRWLETQLCL